MGSRSRFASTSDDSLMPFGAYGELHDGRRVRSGRASWSPQLTQTGFGRAWMNRLSPMSSGARLTPKYSMQSWQLDTMTRAAAAISCTRSHRSIRTSRPTAPST